MESKVLVSLPSSRSPKYKMMQSLVTMAIRHKHHQVYHFIEGSLIHKARNKAVVEAVANRCTHLMFIDDDMVFPPDAVDTLIDRDKDIIGGLCFGRKEQKTNYPIIKKIVNNEIQDFLLEDIPTWEEPFEVSSTGTGSLLMNMNVFKKLEPPFFYFADPEDFGMERQPFPDNEFSEDTTFMMSARKAGFKIFVDPTITIGHLGEATYKRELSISVEAIPMDQEKVAILIPTVDRLENIKKCVGSIKENTILPYKIYIMTSDASISNWCIDNKIAFYMDEGDDIRYNTRINFMFKNTNEPYLFTGSDDIVFEKGWLEGLMGGAGKGYGVVGANDGYNPMATNFLIKREYIEKQSGCIDTPGVIFYPKYQHNFVDVELLATAKKRNQYVQVVNAKVTHHHWRKDPSKYDKTYQWADERVEKDMYTWHERKKKFNLSYSL